MTHFYVIHTSNMGLVLKAFRTNEAREKWCLKQDATFETYIAVDGKIDDVFIPNTGENQ